MRLATLVLVTSLLATPALAQEMKLNADADISKAPAGTYALEKNHGSIVFKVMHMGYAPYVMRFNDFDAEITLDPTKPENSSVTATIIPASLDSHNQQLTQHVSGAEFLDTEKFPNITFKSTAIEKTGPNKGKITGNLTIHGVTKPVVLDTTFHAGGIHPMMKKYDIGFTATTTIKRSDFGVSGFLPLVGDEIPVEINAEFVQK